MIMNNNEVKLICFYRITERNLKIAAFVTSQLNNGYIEQCIQAFEYSKTIIVIIVLLIIIYSNVIIMTIMNDEILASIEMRL